MAKCQTWVKLIQRVCLSLCDTPSKFTRSECHILGVDRQFVQLETECPSRKLSQLTVRWVDALFGSKCRVVGLSVDGLSKHHYWVMLFKCTVTSLLLTAKSNKLHSESFNLIRLKLPTKCIRMCKIGLAASNIPLLFYHYLRKITTYSTAGYWAFIWVGPEWILF